MLLFVEVPPQRGLCDQNIIATYKHFAPLELYGLNRVNNKNGVNRRERERVKRSYAIVVRSYGIAKRSYKPRDRSYEINIFTRFTCSTGFS